MALVIALLLAGMVLLALEWVLPGGIIGLVGFCCLAGGVAATYAQFGAAAGHLTLAFALAASVAGFLLWLRYFPHSKAGRVFVSEGRVGGADFDYDGLKGQTGKAASDLRPSGAAEIGGRRYDVVADGAFVAQGAEVKVVDVEGNRIVVRALDF